MPKRTDAANQERKQAARDRFWQLTLELQAGMADCDPNKVEAEIARAIAEVRREKRLRHEGK